MMGTGREQDKWKEEEDHFMMQGGFSRQGMQVFYLKTTFPAARR
jgi:hypothetical protein